MISFSIIYIFLSFVAIIGVIFVVHGLTKTPQEEIREMMLRDPNPHLPETFDVPFIERQLQKIQNSPAMIPNYFIALRTKFNLDRQVEVLNKMEQRNTAVADLIKSGARINEETRGLRISEGELHSVGEDLKIRSLRRQLEIAELENQIQNLQPKPPENPTRKNTPSPEEVREKMEGRWKVQADDAAALDRFIRNRLAEMDEEERQELEELEREMELSEEYKQRKRYEIQSRYAKRKDKLFNDIPH